MDAEPWIWTKTGEALDLFAESQEPYNAHLWKRKREMSDVVEIAKNKAPKFNKTDLTALALDKKLGSKAAVLEYAQEHGTVAMQVFVQKHQRKIGEYLADAKEWSEAKATAASERRSDWQVVCDAACRDCPLGESCTYAVAAKAIAASNTESLNFRELAVALRAVICQGPSKTRRVPMIAGGTNTGKTTLLLPFDKLFGFSFILHKPALHSKFALRNITKDKRFIFWDDFRPAEYAQDTVPVATFLTLFTGLPFEVQVSQSFQDGNSDFSWNRGAVLTGKEEGLWAPFGCVGDEDVRHMMSRIQVFRCNAKIQNLRDTEPCAIHLAKWLVHESTAFDIELPIALPAGRGSAEDGGEQVVGLRALLHEARIPKDKAADITRDVLETGAVGVRELLVADWRALPAFHSLRPLEARRLLATAAA